MNAVSDKEGVLGDFLGGLGFGGNLRGLGFGELFGLLLDRGVIDIESFCLRGVPG